MRRVYQQGRSAAPRGRTPVVRRRAWRFSANLSSTVTIQGKVRWTIYRETLSGAVFIRFLERLIKDAGRKVFLTVANLQVQRSAPLEAWLREHLAKIELFQLPASSPERHPDESLSGDLQTAGTSTTPAHNLEPLENKVTRHLRKRQKSPSHGTSCFRNQYVQYAAKSPHGF